MMKTEIHKISNSILTLILSIVVIPCLAQDHVTLTNSDPSSGTHIYIAPHYILLNPGYKYTASSGQYMLAYISSQADMSTPYPRWSKRGMYVYLWDCGSNQGMDYIAANPNFANELATYCHNNNITYVVIFDLMGDDGGGWIFGNQGSYMGVVNTQTDNKTGNTYEVDFENFVYILKTTGGVEEIGVGYEKDAAPASNSQDMFKSVEVYNNNQDIYHKVDIISLDEEFWTESNSATDLADFNNVHKYLLKYMNIATQECYGFCNGPSLRVEDYFSYNGPTITTSHEIDQISHLSDRILFAEYWSTINNPNDPLGISDGNWYPGYEEIGKDVSNSYYKKEIWGTFSDQNFSYTNSATAVCQGQCPPYANSDYSGFDLWSKGYENDAEWIESLYYDDVNTYYGTDFNSTDNQFQILGSMWFEYYCMNYEPLKFVTKYLPFYVTVGPDFQYSIKSPPASNTFTATVYGGTAPYTYIWYDINSGNILNFSTTSNTYIMDFNTSTNSYPTTKLGVLVKDATSPTPYIASDYLCIYGQLSHSGSFAPIHGPGGNNVPETETVNNAHAINIVPYHGKGQFIIQSVVSSGSYGSATVEIFTVLGQKIYNKTFINLQGENIINLTNKAGGIYFYRVMSETGNLLGRGKLINEK